MTLKEFPETAAEHRTDKFKLLEKQGTILIRRGQSFKVNVIIYRKWEFQKNINSSRLVHIFYILGT